MSRRPSNAGGGISLFPFLSILACLIGILTILISLTSALKSLKTAGRDKDELARATQHQSLLARQRSIQQQLDAHQATLTSHHAATLQLRDLEQRRIELQRQLDAKSAQLKPPHQPDKALQQWVESLLANLEALRKQRPALDQKLAQLKAELARRTNKPDAKPAPVLVKPGGSGTATGAPVFFVECDAGGLILHRPGSPKSNVSQAVIGTDPGYNQFLGEAKRKPGAMVLFLLRDTGNASYLRAAGWAESQFQLRTGKLPLPGKGEVDLSLFFNR